MLVGPHVRKKKGVYIDSGKGLLTHPLCHICLVGRTRKGSRLLFPRPHFFHFRVGKKRKRSGTDNQFPDGQPTQPNLLLLLRWLLLDGQRKERRRSSTNTSSFGGHSVLLSFRPTDPSSVLPTSNKLASLLPSSFPPSGRERCFLVPSLLSFHYKKLLATQGPFLPFFFFPVGTTRKAFYSAPFNAFFLFYF